MSRIRWVVAVVLVAVAAAGLGAWLEGTPPPTSTTSVSTTSGTAQGTTTSSLSKIGKIAILNKTAQELNSTDLYKEYCSEHSWEKFCEGKVSLHVPEFHHYHVDPVPETPTTFPIPGPCAMLCVVWHSETDVEVENNGTAPVTVLIVTVSMHDGSKEPVPVWLKTVDPDQTATVLLQYGNGSPVGIILYYS